MQLNLIHNIMDRQHYLNHIMNIEHFCFKTSEINLQGCKNPR